MARTFSVMAGHFIDANARSRESVELAEMVANMAAQDALLAMESALIELCPHKAVCGLRGTRVGCDRRECSYLKGYFTHIRGLGSLVLPR